MRRATGERYERCLRRVVVVISHASHDYVRAADDGKRLKVRYEA